MPNYVATYFVTNRQITSEIDGTRLLSDLAGQEVYLQINRSDMGPTAIIDVAQYLLHQRNLDLSVTLQTAVAAMTDLQIDGYETAAVPMRDPDSGVFKERIVAYDAIAEPGVTVAWTSIGSPGLRNDIYRREAMDDLVITAPQKDLSSSLVSVNGVFHKTYLYYDELYVQDGFSNIKNTKKSLVGVYDTTALGGHSILPIQISNIDASNNTPFSGVTLSFPGMDFTGKTLMMVLGGYLHAFDDTFRVINKNRIQVDTCKIDLLNQFLHNPNTLYTKSDVAEAVFEDRLRTHRDAAPTVHDKMMWYLWNLYPTAREADPAPANLVAFDPPPGVPPPIPAADQITYYLTNSYPWARANSITSVNVMTYTRHAADRPDAPPVMDDMYAYLLNFRNTPSTDPVELFEFEWTTKYKQLTNVVGTIPSSTFNAPSFVYNMLLSRHTFFVVINNPRVYARKYPLTRTETPGIYTHFGTDTPRGSLIYNKQSTIPFLIYSDSRRLEHNVNLGFDKIYRDAYKSSINPGAVPSPLYDIQGKSLPYQTELLELYSS